MTISRKDLGWIFDEECKMKRTAKTKLVAACLVIVGLFTSVAFTSVVNAKSALKEKPSSALTLENFKINVTSPDINLARNYAYPSITSEVFNKFNSATFYQTPVRPLQGIQVVGFTNLIPHKYEKKNSIFEFAAKFNDKLQQFLAYFGFSSKTITERTNEKINEKEQSKKSRLIAQHEKKAFKSNCFDSKS